jgi:uncharacterized protein
MTIELRDRKMNQRFLVVQQTDGSNTYPMVEHDGEQHRVLDIHGHYAGEVDRFDPTIRRIFDRLRPKHKERGLNLQEVGRNPAALLDYMNSVGIDKVCLLAEEGPPTGYSVDSSFVLGYCSQAPGRLFAFGNVNPRIDRNLARRCEGLIRAGVRGFKLYASDHNQDPQAVELAPLFELCNAYRLPMMFHSGTLSRYPMTNPKYGEAATWEPLIRKYEAIPFIAAHGGKGGQQREFRRLVQEYPNLYVDVSDMPYHVLEQSLAGDPSIWGRYVFGTDMPQFPDVRVVILKVLKLPLSTAAKRAILYDNAARLLGLVDC